MSAFKFYPLKIKEVRPETADCVSVSLEVPARVEYEATLKARELGQLFREMDVWASHNTLTVVSSVSIVGRA